MPSSAMWRRVGLLETDVSKECIYSIFSVEEKCERIKVFDGANRLTTVRRAVYPEDGGDVPPKRRFIINPHDAKFQKTAFFIVTAVKTSSPKY
jgi:hypothetical protein